MIIALKEALHLCILNTLARWSEYRRRQEPVYLDSVLDDLRRLPPE